MTPTGDMVFRLPVRREMPVRSSTALRVVSQPAGIDLPEAERAAADFLRALGISLDSESLRDTPRRMAKAYAELNKASLSAQHAEITNADVFVTAAHAFMEYVRARTFDPNTLDAANLVVSAFNGLTVD